jgi:TonB family protein
MTTAQGLPPLAAGARLDDFEIVDVVEQARYTTTYLARDGSGTEVLIKELLPQEFVLREDGQVRAREAEDRTPLRFWLRSFLDKAVLLQKLNHPGLIRVLRQFEANGTGYCVTERVTGESLAAIIEREGTLSEAQLRRLLAPVLGGLEQAHAIGLLHRDIRPESFMVRPDDSAVLVDFGELRAPIRFKSRTVFSAGQPPYAAPEEFYMAGPHGPWTDIYGLGATAYRVLTGQAPPDARSRATGPVLTSLAATARVRCSEAMVSSVDSALQLSAEMRPQSVAMWRSLLQGSAEEATDAAPATLLPGAVSQARPGGRPGLLPLIGVAVVVLAAGGYFFLRPHRAADTPSADLSAPPQQGASSAPEAADAVASASPAASATAGAGTAAAPAAQDQASLDRLAMDLMSKEKKVEEAQKQLQEERDAAAQAAARANAATGKGPAGPAGPAAAAPPQPTPSETEAAEHLKQLQIEVDRLREEKAAQSAQVALSAPAGAPAATAASSGGDWSSWYRQAVGTVRQKLQYPQSSEEAGEEGDITVKVRLRRDGGIVSTDLQKRSASTALNQEAIDVFSRVGRFAPLPSGYQPNNQEVDVTMPINFKLAE